MFFMFNALKEFIYASTWEKCIVRLFVAQQRLHVRLPHFPLSEYYCFACTVDFARPCIAVPNMAEENSISTQPSF